MKKDKARIQNVKKRLIALNNLPELPLVINNIISKLDGSVTSCSNTVNNL